MKKTPKYYTLEETTVQLNNIAGRRNLSPKDFLAQLGAHDIKSAVDICSKQNIVINMAELEILFPITENLQNDVLKYIDDHAEIVCVNTDKVLQSEVEVQTKTTVVKPKKTKEKLNVKYSIDENIEQYNGIVEQNPTLDVDSQTNS